MRSLEKSHRSADIDQIDPEHTNRAEFSWDDLKKVPFNNSQQQSSKRTTDTTESLKNIIDDLPTNDKVLQSNKEEEARQRVQAVLQKMDGIGAFGKEANSSGLSTQEFNDRIRSRQEASRDDDKKLSDISTSF